MRILVTGGDGMLAQAIRNLCPAYPFEIVFCNKYELDITNLIAVERYFQNSGFGCIINCAAYTNVEAAESNVEAAYLINETGTKNLAIIASKYKIPLIHISTDAVYDGDKKHAYSESDACNPLSIYSKSKFAGELAIQEPGTNGIIIRTSWLYSLDKANFVTAILKKARSAGKLSVVFDQLGTPTYTYDLGLAILDIIKKNFDYINTGMNIYHYSNEGAISWYDFAVNCCRIAGVNAAITPVFSTEYPTKVERPFHAIMSKAKIKNDFNLSIPYWRDSLEKCLADKNKLENF